MTPEEAINDIQYYLEGVHLDHDTWNNIETVIFDLDDAAFADGQNTVQGGTSNYARNQSRHTRLAPIGSSRG